VEIRRWNRSGTVVYSGVVDANASVTVTAKRVWARFGALGNLELFLNGRVVQTTHSGTVDAVVTAKGLRF
jgi:hypothetical protein